MTIAEATEIIRECARSDFKGETGGTSYDPKLAIQMWVDVSEDAEDETTLAAIDMLGRDSAARIYRERIIDIADLGPESAVRS